jgi:pyrimidine operon attenuation protein / uracil phosphoribosyltransferase
MPQHTTILSKEQIEAKLLRMAYEIVEHNLDCEQIVLAGIQQRGSELAKIIAEHIRKISNVQVNLIDIIIDKNNPIDCTLSNNNELNGNSIIVVDDVANSGRTLLYALHPFLNVLAKRIQVAVLVDRKHKSYPISADFVGLTVATTLHEHISVQISKGKILGAYLQ